MGKMTLLYLSISLALIPNNLFGGWGGSVGTETGSSGARVSEHTCLSDLSLGSVSTPSLTVHVNIQHVWNRTQACNTIKKTLQALRMWIFSVISIVKCYNLFVNVLLLFCKNSHWKTQVFFKLPFLHFPAIKQAMCWGVRQEIFNKLQLEVTTWSIMIPRLCYHVWTHPWIMPLRLGN